MELRILEYDDVLNLLEDITGKDNNFCKQEFQSTKYDNIKIPYYTYGFGDNHIIVMGGTHGSEIISVDLVIRIMENISSHKEETKDFTIHFIPVLNPEGYIISTFMIRTLLKKDSSQIEIETISNEYFLKYRQDDIDVKEDPNYRNYKHHQEMFKNASYKDIPDKYPNLKNSIKTIYEENGEIPIGSIVVWRGNGDGIETNRDNPHVEWIDMVKEGKKKYGINRYNNIPDLVKGPLGAICYDLDKPEEHTLENTFLLNLIDKLYKEKKYCGMYTYHGTGSLIYYKPSKLSIGKTTTEEKRNKFIQINNTIAENYIKNTSYIISNGETISKYTKVEDPDFNAMDEYLRSIYPAVLLIEISRRGGNPLGPYSNLIDNYIPTMNINIDAFYNTIQINKMCKKDMY